jgi:phage terminase large subunit
MNSIDLNPKYQSLFNSDSRYHVVTGGRGSGKSFGVNTFLVLLTLRERSSYIVYSIYNDIGRYEYYS